MANRKHEEFFESVYHRILCEKLMIISGINVSTHKNCESLALEMGRNGYSISSHTLARLFGILPFRKTYPATLDILANYLGHVTFSYFIKHEKQNLERGLNTPENIFGQGAYSMIALELAIEINDTKTIKKLLESVDLNSPDSIKISALLGTKVRRSKNKNELLQTLISIESGRKLFYESYVDEDDASGYFSSAIESYYLPHVSLINNKIFGYCFLISNGIYSNKSVTHLLKEFEKFKLTGISRELHFHEISRLIECKILIDGSSGKINNTYLSYIEELLSYEHDFDKYSFAWIIARPIKALAFNGMLKKSLLYTPLSEAIIRCYRNSNVGSVAELILQFVVHSQFKKSKDFDFQPPLKLYIDTQDKESNARVILESVTSSIYAGERVQVLLKNNIHSFAKQTNQTWVFELLE